MGNKNEQIINNYLQIIMIIGRIASRIPKELTRTLTIQKRYISTNFIRCNLNEIASKSAYEAEVEKFTIKDNKFHESHGFINNSPYEDAMFHKIYYFIWCTLIIGVGFPILFYGPDEIIYLLKHCIFI